MIKLDLLDEQPIEKAVQGFSDNPLDLLLSLGGKSMSESIETRSDA